MVSLYRAAGYQSTSLCSPGHQKETSTRPYSYPFLPSTLLSQTSLPRVITSQGPGVYSTHIFPKSTPALLSLPIPNIDTALLSPPFFLRVLSLVGFLHHTSRLQVGITGLGSLPQPLSVRSVQRPSFKKGRNEG